MIWKFYAKLVMHAPMRTLMCQKFYRHVMLGLKIHFLYLSQPNVSTICSFVNLCIHPSPFRASGEISQRLPFRCRHIFFQKLVMISDFFSKKSWKSSLFKSMLVFQLNNLFSFSFFLSFSYLFSFFPYLLSSFIFFLFLFLSWFLFVLLLFIYLFLDDVPKRKTLHGSRISNIIDSKYI